MIFEENQSCLKHNTHLRQLNLFILKELIKIARDHTVIQLLYLICSFTVESLKAVVRGDDVDLPGSERAEVHADVSVESLDLLDGADSLAVGGISHDSATPARCRDTSGILTKYLHRI